MSSVFRVPDRIVTGWGCLADLGREAAAVGRTVLVVTGRRALRKAGITDRAVATIEAAGLRVATWEQAEQEPEVTNVDACRAALHDAGADVVVGMGGGSAMDVAKVAAGLAGEDAPTAEFLHGRGVSAQGVPFIAVPTTSGTGSEATINGVVSDHAAGVKASIRDERFMARAALVDPELTVPCPRQVTAHSGLDALSQAVESYASKYATAITEALSLRAAELLAGSLVIAAEEPGHREARTATSLGSLMAGIALGNARLGVIHGIVHPLGVRYGVPHGQACGIMLPAALEFNREAMGAKYARLAEALGGDPVAVARDLLARLGVEESLASLNIPSEDYGAIADESLPSGSLKANPRPVARDDIIAMLEQLC